ncbi:hypothetical protein KI387_019229, partial [Taxus chinensis]
MENCVFSMRLALLVLFSFSKSAAAFDQHSLLAFKAGITLDPNNSLANWSPNTSFCNWTGVICSSTLQMQYRVVGLNLSNMGLEGVISPLVGNLSALQTLDLSNNALHGHIPPQLGRLSSAHELLLHRNRFQGTIPSTLCGCRKLVELSLSYNKLEGSIPKELGLLPHLVNLYLGANYLTGTLPPSLCNLSALIVLGVYTNNLTGPIPTELGSLTQLQILYLYENQLSGTIPTSIGNLSALNDLALGTNNLTGPIPAELGRLTKLKSISLYQNHLTGPIPTSLLNCTTLVELAFYSNQLSGQIPRELGSKLANLQLFSLWENKLTGKVPNSIGNCSKLELLFLGFNQLTGMLPTELSKLTFVKKMRFEYNKLDSGSQSLLVILAHLTNCSHMEYLDMSHNYLAGVLPPSIGLLSSKLFHLNVSYNMISGNIPQEITNLTNLTFLSLSHNLVRGYIPSGIKRLHVLETLDLSANMLKGSIPDEIGQLQSLGLLNVSHNKLSGRIPDSLGLIPDALSKLKNLETIDLSSNFLSGAIPMSIKELKALHYINLDFNNLTGIIPEQGLFPNKPVIALMMGNPGLCGPQKYLLPACQKRGQGKLSLRTKVIISAVGVIALVLCSLILGIMWRRKFLRQHFDLSNSMSRRLGYLKFTYQDLFIATNGFDESNLLGVGNFGSVYKGILRDDKVVAIKVINSPNEGLKSFKAECKVLRRIRHRNLIRVISACSYLNFKGLVLQFASNGSLEKYLYADNIDEEDVCRLGLSECVNIAIDVVHGMEYLHYDCPVQVVHCDLKPANVLLDSNMAALVTDFGISRLNSSTNSMDSLSITYSLRGSIGYIAP